MFKTLAALLLLAAGLPLCAQDTNSVQSWTSSDGKITQAKFVRMEADAVVIERDGKLFAIPFTKLAPASVELAKRLQGKTTGEGATTTQIAKKNEPATITATDPTIQFRWLQTDPKTADAIVDVIKANNLSADAFSAKLDPQIKGGKISEVAAFDRKIVSGERFVLKPASDKIPLVMEAEATVSQDGRLVDLRCVPEWTPMGSGLLRSNTATVLTRQHWYLFARWGDGKTDTLLLACGGSNHAKPAVPQATWAIHGIPVMVHLDAEWRETSAADLAKVLQTPPESRAKALVWLRGRSTLLASASGFCKGGQKSRHEHLWGGKTDAELKEELNKHPDRDPKQPPPRPGVTFVWEPSILASDKPVPTFSLSAPIEENVAKANEYILSQELNLRLNATYVPLKPKGKSPETEYVFNGKLQSGVPEFVAAKEVPHPDEPVVVLVITPWYDIIR